MAITMGTEYDHPDRPPAKQERTKAVFANFRRSLTDYMDDTQRDKFKAFYKAYRSYSEIQDDGSLSNLSVPLISAHIDSFYSRLVGMRPVPQVLPREPGDVARAQKQRFLIDYQWDAMRMLLHAAMLAKSGLIYGIGWGKCTWRKEIRRRLVRESFEVPSSVLGIDLGPFAGLMGGLDSMMSNPRMDDVAVWDDPWYENIPPDQVYPDPDGYSIDTCRYVIHRTRMSLDELEALAKGGEIKVNRAAVGRLKKALEGGSLLGDEVETTLQQEIADTFGGTDKSDLGADPTKRDFTLLEHWTDERVRWAVSGNESIELLRDEPHALGMKPFVRFTPEPLPNELIGTSLTEKLYSIWLEMNTLKNARMDNIMKTAHPQIMIPRGSMTNPAHIRFKAGGYFLADPSNPPQIFQYPELKVASYREMADLRQMAEEIGGTRTFRGVGEEGDTTATEANLLAQASGTKFGAMLQQMNEQPFRRLGKLMVRLNELNVTEERSVRILGEEASQTRFEPISPQDLASRSGNELDVTIDIASKDPDTQIIKRRRTTEAFTAMAQASQVDPALVPLAREMAIEMAEAHEIKNAKEKVAQGEQAMQQQQQQMMQQMQQMQGQGGGGGQPGSFQGQGQAQTEGGQLAADMGNASGLPS